MMDPQTLATLFSEGIYLIPEKQHSSGKAEIPADAAAGLPTLQVKGDNRQEVLILVDHPTTEIIDPAMEPLLMKMMGAVGLTLQDIAIINLHNVEDEQLLETFPCRKALLFGTNMSWRKQENYELYQHEGKSVICSHPLTVVGQEEQYKRLLWNAMKKMFSI